MGALYIVFVTIFSLLFSLSWTKTVQDDWIQPSTPDNSTILRIGEQYTIAWNDNLETWFASYAPSVDVTNSDLWITGFYQHQYTHLVASSVSVSGTFSTIWKVELPSEELSASAYWVFRFVASGVDPNATSDQVSSPGVWVQNTTGASASSPTSTTKPSQISGSATSQSVNPVPTPAPAPNPTPLPTPGSSAGLSSGAKAGISVGTILGAALLVGLGWLMARKRLFSRNSYGQAEPNSPTIYPEATTGVRTLLRTSDKAWNRGSRPSSEQDLRKRQSGEFPPRVDPMSYPVRDHSYALNIPVELEDRESSIERN